MTAILSRPQCVKEEIYGLYSVMLSRDTLDAKISNHSFLFYACITFYILLETYLQYPLLLTWFNFNPSMDK